MFSTILLAYIIFIGISAVDPATNSTQPSPNSLLLTVIANWDDSSFCVGGSDAITSTDVRVTYTFQGSEGQTKTGSFDISRDNNVVTKNYSVDYEDGGTLSLTLQVEQLEHGGGKCNCVYGHLSVLSPKILRYV